MVAALRKQATANWTSARLERAGSTSERVGSPCANSLRRYVVEKVSRTKV